MSSSTPREASSTGYALLSDQPVLDVGDDCLDSIDTARKLVKILRASIRSSKASQSRSSPFVLAIDAAWGAGKSSLLNLISAELMTPEGEASPTATEGRGNKRGPHSEGNRDSPIRCVQFNAWTAQNSVVLDTLITAVLDKLDPNFLRKWAHLLARRRGLLSALRISVTIAAGFFGFSRAVDNLMTSLSISTRTRNELRDSIQDVLGGWLEAGNRDLEDRALVVFVDDIDRCSDETIIQLCEAIKLYLDVKGLIFILACDLLVLARGVVPVARGGVSEAYSYLDKIIQVSYRVPPLDDDQIVRLIKQCSDVSGTGKLIDGENAASKTLAEVTRRNPRRIKRIINSFILDYTLEPGWGDPPLDVEKLIKCVLLYQLYPWFYNNVFVGNDPGDLTGAFLGYVKLVGLPDDSDWREVAQNVCEAFHTSMRGENLNDVLEHLEKALPSPLRQLARDRELISLLESFGNMDDRQAIRDMLTRSPLRSGLSTSSLAAALQLNALTNQLQSQVMRTEGAAATEQAEYQELQIESDANNAAANSVAQAAAHKMKTNNSIFQTFDGIISGQTGPEAGSER